MSNVLTLRDSLSTDITNSFVTNDVDTVSKKAGKGMASLAVLPAILSPVLASSGMDAFFSTLGDKMKAIYNSMKGYVHVFAAVLIAIALVVRLFSKNPRSIEEANAWIKNIILTWLAFNMISIIVSFMGDFKTKDFQNPWDAK